MCMYLARVSLCVGAYRSGKYWRWSYRHGCQLPDVRQSWVLFKSSRHANCSNISHAYFKIIYIKKNITESLSGYVSGIYTFQNQSNKTLYSPQKRKVLTSFSCLPSSCAVTLTQSGAVVTPGCVYLLSLYYLRWILHFQKLVILVLGLLCHFSNMPTL